MLIKGAIPESILRNEVDTENGSIGAIAVFVGKVRSDFVEGRKVEKIEFTAQQSITEAVAAEIIDESIKRFGILNAEVWHSIGTVATGQACFLVKVYGQHRNESFAALPHIVDEIKRRCPIFGKEILAGGEYVWKEINK